MSYSWLLSWSYLEAGRVGDPLCGAPGLFSTWCGMASQWSPLWSPRASPPLGMMWHDVTWRGVASQWSPRAVSPAERPSSNACLRAPRNTCSGEKTSGASRPCKGQARARAGHVGYSLFIATVPSRPCAGRGQAPFVPQRASPKLRTF